MTRDISPDLQNIKLYLTQPHRCSYLPGQMATTAFVDPDVHVTPPLYSQLSRMGFRRSGKYFYTPRCQFCKACISTRIPVAEFSPSRQQKRCRQRNSDLNIKVLSLADRQEHYKLYETYISARHREGDMYPPTFSQFVDFLGEPYASTRFVEFRQGTTLVACAVIDLLDDGVSAIYTYFDPAQENRSPGTLAILTLVEIALMLRLPYVYLGFWVKDCDKMAYKMRFRPIETLVEGEWRRNTE